MNRCALGLTIIARTQGSLNRSPTCTTSGPLRSVADSPGSSARRAPTEASGFTAATRVLPALDGNVRATVDAGCAAYDKAPTPGARSLPRSATGQGATFAVATFSPVARRAADTERATVVCPASVVSLLGKPCQKPRSVMTSFADRFERPTEFAACVGR